MAADSLIASDDTAFLIFIGLNIEICFMFAITGLMATLALPKDKNMRIMGVNNRLFIASTFSIMSVCVELILNSIGALTWDWPWWNRCSMADLLIRLHAVLLNVLLGI